MIVGVDVGNAYMKVSNRMKVASCVVEGFRENDSPSTCYQLDWNGTSWLVGDELEGGVRFVDMSKCEEEEYKVLVLTGLALAANSERCDVQMVTGVPVDYSNSHAGKYQQALKSIKTADVRLRGLGLDKKVKIVVKDAYVVEQAALNLGSHAEDYEYPAMFLDFGGGTFDVSCWSLDEKGCPRRDRKHSDYDLGFDKIIQQFADSLKEQYDYSEDWTKCRDYLHQDTMFLDGEDVTIKTIRDRVLSRYAKRVHTVVRNKNMNYRNVRKIILLGGCADLMLPYLQQEFKKANFVVDEDPQFSNARLFEDIGRTLFVE